MLELKTIRRSKFTNPIGLMLVASILCSTLVSAASLFSIDSSQQYFTEHAEHSISSTVVSESSGISDYILFETLFEEEVDDESNKKLIFLCTILHALSILDIIETAPTANLFVVSNTSNFWGQPLYIAFHSLKIPSRI